MEHKKVIYNLYMICAHFIYNNKQIKLDELCVNRG